MIWRFFRCASCDEFLQIYERSILKLYFYIWHRCKFCAWMQTLYEKNVRKVVFMGIAPIGCTPHYLMLYGSKNGECVDEINNVVIEFNYAMRYMIDELNHELSDAKITFCDAFNGSMDILANRNLYGEDHCCIPSQGIQFLVPCVLISDFDTGFQTTTEACCGLGKYRGSIMCLLPEMACSNASTYVWWDEFHPTDAVNRILANNIWSGEHTVMCHPMNLLQMIDSGHWILALEYIPYWILLAHHPWPDLCILKLLLCSMCFVVNSQITILSCIVQKFCCTEIQFSLFNIVFSWNVPDTFTWEM